MDIGFSGGTQQQQRWVEDALRDCSYDISLIGATVTVSWADPVPASPDLGHTHSYMVTRTEGQARFSITIASWADDHNHPENQGLPNPAEDVYDFYKQAFVHELGHVVHFTTITTDQERAAAAAYFWTPDVTGGSGRRGGTLADWSSGTWANNMMEAIAESFKCASYTGRLIYGNRTIWRIDKGNAWNGLWGFLLPPLKPLWKSQFLDFLNGVPGSAGESVPGQFGVKYLIGAHAFMNIGPMNQPRIDPCLNPGGNVSFNLNVAAASPGGQATDVAGIEFIGGFTNAGLGCIPPGGDWSAALGQVIITFQQQAGIAFPLPTNPGVLALLIDATAGGNPGDLDVHIQVVGAGVDLAQTLTGFPGDTVLTARYGLSTSGLINPNVGPMFWSVASALTFPDFPFASTDGVIAPGAAARGLIRVGR